MIGYVRLLLYKPNKKKDYGNSADLWKRSFDRVSRMY